MENLIKVKFSEKEKIELLASDGMLIKRPIFISSKGILKGFQEVKWKELIQCNKEQKN